jgi:hypothetical protein
MNAGSKVILKRRLLKRLAKIKAFLADCANKQDVRKKVEESYAKALDAQQGFTLSVVQFVCRNSCHSVLALMPSIPITIPCRSKKPMIPRKTLS